MRPPGARRTPQRQVQGDPALRFDRRDRSLFAAATQQQHAEQSEDQQQDDHPAPVLRVRRRFNRLRNRRRGRGGRRRRGPHRLAPGQLLLQFGDLAIALLQLFLQGLQLALQIVHPLAQFLPLPGQRLGLGIRLALRLDESRRSVFHHGGIGWRQDFHGRLLHGAGRASLRLVAGRQAQARAGLEPVPVGIDEGLRIELVQSLHELRAIGVAGTTQASADGPEVVAGASQVFVARLQQCRVYDDRGTTRRRHRRRGLPLRLDPLRAAGSMRGV